MGEIPKKVTTNHPNINKHTIPNKPTNEHTNKRTHKRTNKQTHKQLYIGFLLVGVIIVNACCSYIMEVQSSKIVENFKNLAPQVLSFVQSIYFESLNILYTAQYSSISFNHNANQSMPINQSQSINPTLFSANNSPPTTTTTVRNSVQKGENIDSNQ